MRQSEKWLAENANDQILAGKNGDFFEGTRDQWRDCYFDNADDYQITCFCLKEWLDLEINGKKIIEKGKLTNAHRYLGKTYPNLEDTPYHDFKPSDWAMLFIEKYSQIDGDHHKSWVLDQVARILKGSEVMVRLAMWEHTHEYRICVDEPSKEYLSWIEEMKCGGEYDYEKGIAP